MNLSIKVCLSALVIAGSLIACTAPKEETKVTTSKASGPLADKINQFAPTELTADTSRLSENDRKALDKLIEAAKYLDPLFLRQVWSRNAELLEGIKADTSPEGKE